MLTLPEGKLGNALAPIPTTDLKFKKYKKKAPYRISEEGGGGGGGGGSRIVDIA